MNYMWACLGMREGKEGTEEQKEQCILRGMDEVAWKHWGRGTRCVRLNCWEPVTVQVWSFKWVWMLQSLLLLLSLCPICQCVMWAALSRQSSWKMNSGHGHTCYTFLGSHMRCGSHTCLLHCLTHSIFSSLLSAHEALLPSPWRHSSAFSSYFRRIQSAVHACHRPCLLVYGHTDSLSLLSSV